MGDDTDSSEGSFDVVVIGAGALAKVKLPEEATKSARVPGGYDVIVRTLAEGLDVRTGHAVERIEWKPGSVHVHGTHPTSRERFGPVRARSAVVTLPLGVLAAPAGTPGRPEIEPFPSAWSDALRGVRTGSAFRMLLLFDRPVAEVVDDACPERFDGFIHAPEATPQVFWTLSPLFDRVLVAWAGGPRTRELPRRQRELVPAAFRVLVEHAGLRRDALDVSLVAVFSHDWISDPWTRGAYAYPAVGREGAREALALPVEGTLFLAGEATSEEEMGTVEGALESGRRAARGVLGALGGDGV